jgi:hypothetical protein
LKQLAAQAREEGSGRTCWLATADQDGSRHLAAVGALWVDDKFYFVSGSRLRKSRNLAANPRCAVSVSLGDIDVPHRLPVEVFKENQARPRVVIGG